MHHFEVFDCGRAGRPARAQAVRDLHLHERTFLSAKLEPIEPLEPLPDYPLHVDLTKRTLPGLAVVSGKLSGLRHAIRPSGVAANGKGDLCSASMSGAAASAHQRGRDLVLRDGDAFFATRDVTEITITRPTPARFIGCRVPREQVAYSSAGSTTRRCISFRTHRGAGPPRLLCERDCRRSATRYSGAATARRHPHA